jgi:hypothetical protein
MCKKVQKNVQKGKQSEQSKRQRKQIKPKLKHYTDQKDRIGDTLMVLFKKGNIMLQNQW